jgi:hypothetical protein
MNEMGLARIQLNNNFVVRHKRHKRYNVKHNKKTEVAVLRWVAYHSLVCHGASISSSAQSKTEEVSHPSERHNLRLKIRFMALWQLRLSARDLPPTHLM